MRRCKSLLYAGGAVHLILLFIYYYVQQLRAHSAGQGGKMTQYTTQMDAARQGIITPQMEIVAEKNTLTWKN